MRATAEPRQERAHRPERAQVVDAHHLLDPFGLAVQEPRPRRNARVADEQLDRRMSLEDARGDRVDSLPVGDVAFFVLVRLRGPARKPDHVPALCLKSTHQFGSDAGARAGDDRYPQTRISRPEVAARPFAS